MKKHFNKKLIMTKKDNANVKITSDNAFVEGDVILLLKQEIIFTSGKNTKVSLKGF